VCNDAVGDNVTCLLSCHCNRTSSDEAPKEWCKEGGTDQEGSEGLGFSTVIKYFELLFPILQNCWPNHPKLQGAQDNRPQWWIEPRSNLQKGHKKCKIRGEEDVFDARTMSMHVINQPKLTRFDVGLANTNLN